MRTARGGVEALFDALTAHGGTVARLVGPPPGDADGEPGPPQIAADGPRAGARGDEYELLLEMILEGARLHYGPQRVVRTDDPDLALLVGDQLYALGLARLAALGDIEAVTELADVISLVSQAQAAADPELAAAIWEAGAVAVGWGSSEHYLAAKQLARDGDRQAAATLREAARRVRSVTHGS